MTPKPHRNGFNYLLLMYMHYIGVYLHRYEPNLKKKLRRFRRFSAALFCIDSIPSIRISASEADFNYLEPKTNTKLQPPIFPGSFLKILMNGWHANLFYHSILIYWFTSLSRKLAQLRQNDPYRTERRTGLSEHHRRKLLLETCSVGGRS